MHGRTTSIRGIITPRTASEVHGTGAATMIHGTATHGTGTHGHTVLGDITDGTTHGTMEASMTHGTTADITEVTTATCTHTTTDGTADGILIGDTTIITTMACLSTMKTDGTEAADNQAQTACSQAECPHEEARPAQAG